MTEHKIDGIPFAFSDNWPPGRRYCLCENQEIIETYATRGSAEIVAQDVRNWYAKHGVTVVRPIFVFMPGIGFYQEN